MARAYGGIAASRGDAKKYLRKLSLAVLGGANLIMSIYEEAEILKHFREDNQDHLDAFNRVWDNRDKLVEPYAYAVQWIERLKQAGLKVYLLSNYPRRFLNSTRNADVFRFSSK